MSITRRLFLGTTAAASVVGTAAAAPAEPTPTRREQIRHHFLSLARLCEEEFGVPWQVIACSENPDKAAGMLVSSTAGLHDPRGIIGPAMMHGKPKGGA